MFLAENVENTDNEKAKKEKHVFQENKFQEAQDGHISNLIGASPPTYSSLIPAQKEPKTTNVKEVNDTLNDIFDRGRIEAEQYDFPSSF